MGQTVVNEVKPLDLENYQETRTEQGMSPATIDMEITISKTMITKAFYNDIIGGRVLKAFNNIKKKLKKGSNARSRTLTFNEYVNLISVAPVHLRAFLIIAFHTGMRRGEIRQLKWSYIDREGGMIRLPAAIVKEKKNKVVPINYYVEEVLKEQPRALLHDFTQKQQSLELTFSR